MLRSDLWHRAVRGVAEHLLKTGEFNPQRLDDWYTLLKGWGITLRTPYDEFDFWSGVCIRLQVLSLPTGRSVANLTTSLRRVYTAAQQRIVPMAPRSAYFLQIAQQYKLPPQIIKWLIEVLQKVVENAAADFNTAGLDYPAWYQETLNLITTLTYVTQQLEDTTSVRVEEVSYGVRVHKELFLKLLEHSVGLEILPAQIIADRKIDKLLRIGKMPTRLTSDQALELYSALGVAVKLLQEPDDGEEEAPRAD